MSFRDLHYAETPLVLPNAWDLGSAIAFLDAGFEAIGTTSFGVGATAGQPDGARASKDATAALATTLNMLPVHVSADIEDGYADDPDTVADFVAGLGLDGVNIEDSTDGTLIDPEHHAAKVAAIKSRTPGTFVNARVDNYWLGQDANLTAVLDRAADYVRAGADGIFVPGAAALPDLVRLAAEVTVPLNVLVVPDLSLKQLSDAGIRRVSTGSLPYRAALDAAVTVATTVRTNGLPPSATPYPQVQKQLLKYQRMLSV